MQQSVRLGSPSEDKLKEYIRKEIEGFIVYMTQLFENAEGLPVKIGYKKRLWGPQLYLKN